jgi:ABC-type molybdate transport system substrate-binding protein
MRSHGQAKVSTVGTVNEVAQIVKLRPDHVGIVWDATAAQLTGVATVRVDRFDQAVQEATVGVLASAQGERATAALQFARYLTARDRGQQRFAQFHYEPIPDADVWQEHPQITFMSGAMLKPGIDETLKQFQAREGVTINTSYNGCGILVAQMKSIRAGGSSDRFPDAYFSCDVSFMNNVQHWFDPSEMISENDMVLIAKKGNPKHIAGLEDLARRDLEIGLGHPKNSALGALTDAMLERAGLRDRVYAEAWQDHIVHTDAGHDLVNKLRAGAIDAAVVYRSNAEATPENIEKHIDLIEISAGDAVARQPFAIASQSEHKYLMRRLYEALTGEKTAERFRSIGFRWVHQSH